MGNIISYIFEPTTTYDHKLESLSDMDNFSETPTFNIPPKPVKRHQIPKNVRNQVWGNYFGISPIGICYCCGREITHDIWHCSHVIAYVDGGKNEVSNLRCCCVKCNLSMGNKNMYQYIKDANLQGPGKKYCNSYLKRLKTLNQI